MTRWQIHKLQRSLGDHRQAWDWLNDTKFASHPMLSVRRRASLLKHFGEGNEHLFVLRDGTDPLAMCILCPQGRLVWSSFLPGQAQIGPTLIADPAHLRSLVDSLPWPAQQLDLLCNDPLVGCVVASTQPPTHRLNHALTINAEVDKSFDEYWARRKKSLRDSLKSLEKRVESDGVEMRIVHVGAPEEVAAAVERYAQLEGAGWKAAQGTALGSDAAQLSFYSELLTSAAAKGRGFVHELWFNGKLAASQMTLARGSMWVALKTTYDETLHQYAPGRLLLRAKIQHSFQEEGARSLEFYTDANADQLAWGDGCRWIQHATFYRSKGAETAIASARILRTLVRRRRKPRPSEDTATWETSHYAGIDQLPEDAAKLIAAGELHNIELGPSWYRNLSDTVFGSDEVRFYTLRRNGKAVAVLPLVAERAGKGRTLQSLSNYYTALYEPALVTELKPRQLAHLLDAIKADFPRLGNLRLAPMDPAAPSYQTLLAALRLARMQVFEFFTSGNWFLPVKQPWDDYLATREAKLRNTISRKGRKFIADGGSFEVLTRAREINDEIEAFQRVYASSWKKPEPYPDFIPGLIRTLSANGRVRLGLARHEGRVVAAQIWLVAHGRAEIYKLAYDPDYSRYSPGTLVTAQLMQHVFEVDKVQEVDYLIGDDPYKQTWMTERRERWGLIAFNPFTLAGITGLLAIVARRTGRAFLNRLGKQPPATKS